MGYSVRCVMNVTDLDDKIIAKGGPRFARQYEHLFFETMDKLNVKRPDFMPRVTDFVAASFSLSQQCILKKFAYYGNYFKTIYFDTVRFIKEYGRIFPKTDTRDVAFQTSPVNETVERNEEEKWDPRDFVLWKSKEWIDAEGNVLPDRPGWHTECATMAYYYFNDYVDIHLGGIDLQFPHHENEIALGCVLSDKKQWVGYCLYTGHLHIEGKKMSKSLKNFTTVDELMMEEYSPLAIRYMLMKHPYQKTMNFNKEELKQAQTAYDHFMKNVQKIKQYISELKIKEEENNAKKKQYDFNDMEVQSILKLNQLKEEMDDFLMDNLNIPKAIETLEKYVQVLSTATMKNMSYTWLQFSLNYVLWVTDKYFGLSPNEQFEKQKNESDSMFSILNDFRINVRKCALGKNMDHLSGKFLLKACDNVREKINRKGYIIEDETTV